MGMSVGKHEAINLNEIKDCLPGNCFHGEVWVICPHCKKSMEIVGTTPIRVKDRYRVFQCEVCGELFKDFIGW